MTRAAIAALVFAAACGRSSSAPPPSNAAPPATVTDRASATAAAGTVVRVAGTAADAKLAAVVDTGALTVYCLDLSHWPAERLGQPVVVEGVLEITDEFEAKTSPTGLVSQGTRGAVHVIRRCTLR